jgi:hypothetical protein
MKKVELECAFCHSYCVVEYDRNNKYDTLHCCFCGSEDIAVEEIIEDDFDEQEDVF